MSKLDNLLAQGEEQERIQLENARIAEKLGEMIGITPHNLLTVFGEFSEFIGFLEEHFNVKIPASGEMLDFTQRIGRIRKTAQAREKEGAQPTTLEQALNFLETEAGKMVIGSDEVSKFIALLRELFSAAETVKFNTRMAEEVRQGLQVRESEEKPPGLTQLRGHPEPSLPRTPENLPRQTPLRVGQTPILERVDPASVSGQTIYNGTFVRWTQEGLVLLRCGCGREVRIYQDEVTYGWIFAHENHFVRGTDAIPVCPEGILEATRPGHQFNERPPSKAPVAARPLAPVHSLPQVTQVKGGEVEAMKKGEPEKRKKLVI